MKAMAQIECLTFLRPKKQAKIIKYCISELTNETEDKGVIYLSDPKKLEKQVKKPVVWPKREKETKKIMYVLYNFYGLHEMVKYEEFCESSYVGEFHANHSVSKTKKRLSLC